MSVVAKWGKKKWRINHSKINGIDNLDYKMSYDTSKKKKEKRTVTLPFRVYKEFGMTPSKELKSWYKLLGKSYGLYLGKKRLGPKKLKLTDVSVSDLNVTDKGIMHSAEISLTFTEP